MSFFHAFGVGFPQLSQLANLMRRETPLFPLTTTPLLPKHFKNNYIREESTWVYKSETKNKRLGDLHRSII